MTERFEVEDIQKELQSISNELKYEADARPGEGPNVESLFLSADQRIREAIELLGKAKKLIGA